MKRKTLPPLMFIICKRNGKTKSRRVANSSFQRIYVDKVDCTSPTLDFHALKYVAAVIAKEKSDLASVDLPRYFLQTEIDRSGEMTIIKFTGTVALLLVEINEGR